MPTISKNDFIDGLKKSGVIEKPQLEEWLAKCKLDSVQEVATSLVKDKLLTKWQAKYLLSGRTRLDIGSYRLLERITRDELGDRFLGFHTSLARKVVIQVLPAELSKNKDSFSGFIKKASDAAKLDHPNLIHVYDIDQEGGRYFLVTEFLEGESLAEKSKSEITESLTAKMVEESITGLEHAHDKGVVHGSIMASDVMFSKSGKCKISHIAISELRNQTDAAPNPKDDFKAISKLGISMLGKIPEESRAANFGELVGIVKSIKSGELEAIQKAKTALTQFCIETADSTFAEDPLANVEGNILPATTRPSKKKTELDEEELVEEPVPGAFHALWKNNPVAVIATAVVAGILLIGGSAFGVMSMLGKDDPVVKTPIKNSGNQIAAKQPKAETKIPELGKGNGQPDFADTKAMEAQIANIVLAEEKKPKRRGKKNQGPKPNKDQAPKDAVATNAVATNSAEKNETDAPENTNSTTPVSHTPSVENDDGPSINNASMDASKETKPVIPEPLERIFGIGNATQQRFYENEIMTFEQLGGLSVEQIKEMLPKTYTSRNSDEDLLKWVTDARKFAGMKDLDPSAGTNASTSSSSGKPDAKSDPKKQATNDEPLKTFPRLTELPAVSDTEEIKIAPLSIKKTYLLGAELVCEEGMSKTRLIFELTRGDKAGDGTSKENKQKWYAGVKRRASEKPTNIGVFRKSEDAFHFQWLPEAEKNKYSEFLRNCFLRLTLPDETQTFVSLRKPMKVRDLRLTPEILTNKLEFSIPAMPHPETIVVEVTPLRVKDTETTVVRPRIEKGLPAQIYLKKNDKTGFLRIQVAGDIKSKIRLQSNLILLIQDQANPVTDLSVFNTLANQLDQQRQFSAGQLAVATKENNAGKKKEWQTKVNKAVSANELLLLYRDVLEKLWGKPISIRVYSKLGSYQLMLAVTDPKLEQPKKRR